MILEHDGFAQPIAEWALDYGIPADLIALRVKAGWTIADAIETEQPLSTKEIRAHRRDLRLLCNPKNVANCRDTFLTFNGQTLTVTQWSREIGVKSRTIHARIKLGLPIERILASGDHRLAFQGVEPTIFITHRGITRSVSRWSYLTGVKVATIRYRHAKGWSPARILSPELVKKPGNRGVGRTSEQHAGTGALPTAQISA